VVVEPPYLKVSWDSQVKALVELVTSLMCTSRPSSGRQAPTVPSNFQEMMRDMVDAGVRKALLQVLRGLDVNHPKAPSPPHHTHPEFQRICLQGGSAPCMANVEEYTPRPHLQRHSRGV
jgi:hypothetical protein